MLYPGSFVVADSSIRGIDVNLDGLRLIFFKVLIFLLFDNSTAIVCCVLKIGDIGMTVISGDFFYSSLLDGITFRASSAPP